jgi:hypothetical protein
MVDVAAVQAIARAILATIRGGLSRSSMALETELVGKVVAGNKALPVVDCVQTLLTPIPDRKLCGRGDLAYRSWFNGESKSWHNHPSSSWSAVYCTLNDRNTLKQAASV